MKVDAHRLLDDEGEPVRFVASPNVGGAVQPKYLVMHYTAGRNAESAIRSLTDPAAKASAHLVISRTREITQLVPFDRVAWHAGVSRWHGLEGLNAYSLGIELDNAGALTRHGNRWRAWFGGEYPDRDVIEAAHKHDGIVRGWHLFPEVQLRAAIDAARALVEAYGLEDVIGHDDIAPGRKIDPGPAFPMAEFRAAVMGRRDDRPPVFETIAELNIRGGPGTRFETVRPMPLPPGTRVVLRSRESSWCFVEVPEEGTSRPELTGWVHGDYIRPVA
jgi:N-acetylmuramoyl-L-alanine amidase